MLSHRALIELPCSKIALHLRIGLLLLPPTNFVCSSYLTSFDKIMNILFQSHELMKLYDWLLPMQMNGQVTVGSSTQPKTAEA